MEKISLVLDTEPEIHDEPGARPPARIEGDLHIDRVDFSYGRDPVLHAVDIHVPAGGCLALVGESGGGKSTTAKLIRALTTDEGAIRVDGVDLRALELRAPTTAKRSTSPIWCRPAARFIWRTSADRRTAPATHTTRSGAGPRHGSRRRRRGRRSADPSSSDRQRWPRPCAGVRPYHEPRASASQRRRHGAAHPRQEHQAVRPRGHRPGERVQLLVGVAAAQLVAEPAVVRTARPPGFSSSQRPGAACG